MEPENLTSRVLVEMRDEMRGLRGDVTGLREDLNRLEQRQSEDAMRIATELVAVAHAVGEVRDLLRGSRDG